MIVQSSAKHVQSEVAQLIMKYTLEALDRDGLALDIIEHIALRLRTHDDDHVFNLGVCVGASLSDYTSGKLSYQAIHSRLTSIALAARGNAAEFFQAIDVPAVSSNRLRSR